MSELQDRWPMLMAIAALGLLALFWSAYRRQRKLAASHRALARRRRETPAAGAQDPASTHVQAQGRARGRQGLATEVAELAGADLPVAELQQWEPTVTRVMTHPERDAWDVLRRALPEYVILAQVPLSRFVKVSSKKSSSQWLRILGSLCADLVVCDMNSQVLAVVEVRPPSTHHNERVRMRHTRLDRILQAARVPLHIWLEGSLPGHVVARKAVLDALVKRNWEEGQDVDADVMRNASAASTVSAMQGWGGLDGLSVDETGTDSVFAQAFGSGPGRFAEADGDSQGGDSTRDQREPPPSTWFDDLDSGSVPLAPLEHSAR